MMLHRKLYQFVKPIVSGLPFLKKLVFLYGVRYDRFPKVLTLVLTYRCQCHCVHCGVAEAYGAGGNELSTQEIINLIDQASKIGMIMQITFTGGEPLLRKDIMELIGYSKKNRFFTKIDTNGALLNAERLARLKEAGLDRIGISIDHYQAEVHDQLRQYSGLFSHIMEVVKICLSLKVSVYLQTYATRENMRNGDLEKIIALAEKTMVDKIKIQPIATLGASKDSCDKMLAAEDFLILDELLSRHKVAYVESEFLSARDHKMFCSVNFKSNIHVTCYGEVQPCCWFPLSFGNVREKKLKEIMDRMYASAAFKKLLKCDGCLCSNQEILRAYFKNAKKLPVMMRE